MQLWRYEERTVETIPPAREIRGCGVRTMTRRAARSFSGRGLTLRLAACQLLDFALVRATGLGTLGLGGSLLAGGTLHFFTFNFVFDLGGISHV